MVDREQQDHELEAKEEGETERHPAATEVDHGRGAQRYPSEDENAYSPPIKREDALCAFEEAEDVRRYGQHDDVPVDVMDWEASTLMRTPVSAPTRAPFVQRQLSPIPSEEEFTYDSAAEFRHPTTLTLS